MSCTQSLRRFDAAQLSALIALALAAAGCTSSIKTDQWLGAITPYRIDVMQGNVITQELAARVKPGMSREQVRDLLAVDGINVNFAADPAPQP